MNSEDSISKRSIKKRQYSWFASELSWLTQKGLLSQETQDRILDQYTVSQVHPIDRSRLWLLTFSTLGVLMFGFAVFLLICHNWNVLSPAWRTLITAGSLALFFAFGVFFKCRRKGIISELSFFFTGILFGVNIWQIAQIYHFDIDFTMGFWLWGIGCLILALGRNLPFLHYLAVGVLAIWVLNEITSPPIYDYFSFLTKGAYSLPFLAAFGYYCGRKNGWTSVCVLYFLLFCWWTIFQINGLRSLQALHLYPFYYIFLGGLNLMAVRYIRPYAVALVARTWGVILLFAFIPLLTFSDFYDFTRQQSNVCNQIPFILEGIAFLILTFFGFTRNIKKGPTNLKQAIISQFLPGGFALLFVPLLLIIHLKPEKESCIFCATFSSIIMFCVALWGILAIFRSPVPSKDPAAESDSYRQKNNRKQFLWSGPILYWFGILYFILWSIFRYIDLFAESFGMPGAAAMFALIGIFLIAAGWFWSRRDRISLMMPPSDPSMENSLFDLSIDSEPDKENIEPIPFQPDRPLTKGEKGFLALAFLFMAATLLFMIGSQIIPFRNATKITVETIPIDPRSLFRGDYVILNYPFSLSSGKIWMNGKNVLLFDVSELQDLQKTDQWPPRSVYSVLRFDSKKKLWTPVKMCVKRPKTISDQEIVLKGNYKRGGRIHYGIEYFFVQEGSGKDIEDAIRSNKDKKKVLVDLWVAPDGRARIDNVRITGE